MTRHITNTVPGKAGQLYGVGVGPGDPELLTLKAVRIIRECDVIVVPGKQKEETIAYKIAMQAVPEIAEKECLESYMPMTRDVNRLKQSHKAAFEKISHMLDDGKNVAFLTLGDPCIYSTYIYIHKMAKQAGYKTQIVSGIPSFCAASARLNQGLVQGSEILHVIPASYETDKTIGMPGTRVLMKNGKNIGKIRDKLIKMDVRISMVENCGMENERVCRTAEEIPDETGYCSIIIARDEN